MFLFAVLTESDQRLVGKWTRDVLVGIPAAADCTEEDATKRILTAKVGQCRTVRQPQRVEPRTVLVLQSRIELQVRRSKHPSMP